MHNRMEFRIEENLRDEFNFFLVLQTDVHTS